MWSLLLTEKGNVLKDTPCILKFNANRQFQCSNDTTRHYLLSYLATEKSLHQEVQSLLWSSLLALHLSDFCILDCSTVYSLYEAGKPSTYCKSTLLPGGSFWTCLTSTKLMGIHLNLSPLRQLIYLKRGSISITDCF